ncbi:MAG: elongation factor G [Ruminococcaceae bacterium]|nr:elongation factor G [Oscillospiraceae bacterium]
MAKFSSSQIRNICLVGHSGDGKTSFAEAMLYLAKVTDRLGKPSEGNTVCDFDPEEIKRGYSISTALASLEWNGTKINILDAPGMFGFAGEAKAAAFVAASTVIVVDAKSGCKVGTELAWEMSAGKPKAFFVNKIDDENSNFSNTFNGLREQFGTSVCPLLIPFNEGTGEVGLYNLITDEVFTCEKKTGKRIEITLPDQYKDTIEEYKLALNESLAITSEELMEKFLMEEPFTEEEKLQALNSGLLSGDIAPVFCGSATDLAGIRFFLDTAAASFVSPLEAMKDADENGETKLFVFKSLADNFGKKVFFKVMNGTLTKDQVLNNITTGQQEKFAKICTCIGKKEVEVTEFVTGDIGYAVKLANTNVNNTLVAGASGEEFKAIEFPTPYYTMAIKPLSKNDEDKISAGITKLLEEDPTLRYFNNAETKQMTISGLGDIHLDVVCAKLKTRFGTGVELIVPKIAYREAIKKTVQVEGKHKKQSGGSGQYGHVKITFGPGSEDGLTFTQSVVGGNVPKNFYPAVEKGLQEAMLKGVLAGFPMANLSADLFDGSYHPVDSNEISFKLAAKLAFKEGLPKASPVILEPVGYLKCTIPTSYSGDIMGDVSKRRGRIMGMSESTRKGYTVIEAEIPSAEMTVYAVQLRAMTQGRGTYTFDFVRYEEAPAEVAAKVIEQAKKDAEE